MKIANKNKLFLKNFELKIFLNNKFKNINVLISNFKDNFLLF